MYELSFYYLIITIEKSRGSHKTPEPYTIYNPAPISHRIIKKNLQKS